MCISAVLGQTLKETGNNYTASLRGLMQKSGVTDLLYRMNSGTAPSSHRLLESV